jgi:hypothetical protein
MALQTNIEIIRAPSESENLQREIVDMLAGRFNGEKIYKKTTFCGHFDNQNFSFHLTIITGLMNGKSDVSFLYSILISSSFSAVRRFIGTQKSPYVSS